uniref:Uncharacterized protein n=1 Tax=Glossina austeni TaxID=7395 RepID=A0A1A9VN37_GLOAU
MCCRACTSITNAYYISSNILPLSSFVEIRSRTDSSSLLSSLLSSSSPLPSEDLATIVKDLIDAARIWFGSMHVVSVCPCFFCGCLLSFGFLHNIKSAMTAGVRKVDILKDFVPKIIKNTKLISHRVQPSSSTIFKCFDGQFKNDKNNTYDNGYVNADRTSFGQLPGMYSCQYLMQSLASKSVGSKSRAADIKINKIYPNAYLFTLKVGGGHKFLNELYKPQLLFYERGNKFDG